LASLIYNQDDFTIGEQTLYEKLIDIRSVSGRAPSIEEAYLADIETVESFHSRMRRYDDNTRYFAGKLDDWMREQGLGYVSSPWLPDHPGHDVAMTGYGTGGRMLFLFFDGERVDEGRLGQLFKDLATTAAEKGISLMAAPSFGLAPPHIHIVIRPELPTSLRVSTGSTDRVTLERLLNFFCIYLREYIS
jgi:cystathionine beta-lyase/cystathionine gamma-synthase